MPTARVLRTSIVVALACLACGGGAQTGAPTASTASSPATAPTVRAPAAAAPTVAPTPAISTRPLYYERVLTPTDLDGRTLRELSLMRNTIFARTGQPFVKPWLNDYFREQPWYQPAATQDLSRMTDVDRQNVALITTAEASFTREQLLKERDLLRSIGDVVQNPDDAVELGLISAALGEWSGSTAVPLAERNPLQDPNVLDGQLTLAQIEGLSRRDLRLLRNTVYARHGRPFTSVVLQEYFANKAWYAEAADYSDATLSDIDKRNIQLVQSMEDRLGGPMKEWEHQKEEGWFVGA